MELAEKAVELQPNSAAYLNTLSWLYYINKDYVQAEGTIKKALMLQPDNRLYQRGLKAVQQAMGNKRSSRKMRGGMRTGKEGRKLIHSGFIFPAIGLLAFWVSGLPVCAQFHFTEVTAQVPLVDSSCRGTGIHFQHTDGRSGEKYFVETLGSGAAWFDYDQDGDLDIYFVNGADLPEMRSDVPPTNALYRNNGDGSFTDVTSDAGVGDAGYGFGCCAGDYDNDGFSDLYVTNFGQNLLYHNNGDGSFTDMTDEAGVGDSRWGTSAAFADYDNDGDIDLFVANYVAYQLENNPVCF